MCVLAFFPWTNLPIDLSTYKNCLFIYVFLCQPTSVFINSFILIAMISYVYFYLSPDICLHIYPCIYPSSPSSLTQLTSVACPHVWRCMEFHQTAGYTQQIATETDKGAVNIGRHSGDWWIHVATQFYNSGCQSCPIHVYFIKFPNHF